MTTAEQYATALFETVSKDPGKSATYLKNLRAALESRGHLKLLPQIFTAYEKLAGSRERSARYMEMTPERHRTKILLELYERLIATDPELIEE